jgi:hypothetical protein
VDLRKKRLGALWVAVMAFGAVAAAQRPCEQIREACISSGFVQRGIKGGNSLQRDCIDPIMQGTPPSVATSMPLPAVDSATVAACKARNPAFGQALAPRSDAGTGPAAANPPAAPHPAVPTPFPPAIAASAARPNIVFVLTDDLSWDLVQYMPHVLQMQKDGITFANYFVTDSLCCPSRSSIFTGRYPHDTGIFRNTGADGGYLAFVRRGLERATFSTALSAAGYRTAMLGKYLNGYLPRQHPPAPGWTAWAVAGNGYPEFNYALNQDGQVVRYGDAPAEYLTDVLSAIAVRFIQKAAGVPFLIEIATFAPHAPYTPAPRDAEALPGLQAPARRPSMLRRARMLRHG